MVTLQNVKTAYVQMYGEFFNTEEYESFDEAFSDAWKSFDFFAGEGELTAEAAAEAMCDCSELEHG